MCTLYEPYGSIGRIAKLIAKLNAKLNAKLKSKHLSVKLIAFQKSTTLISFDIGNRSAAVKTLDSRMG